MAERRPTMMDPPVESLLEKVDSKFTLVTLAAKRGSQTIPSTAALQRGGEPHFKSVAFIPFALREWRKANPHGARRGAG